MPALIRTALVASLFLGSIASAAAQTTPEALDVRVELLRQPPWHEPEDELGIELELTNVGDIPLEGYHLQVGVQPRVTSRSQLHAAVAGETGFPTSLYTIERPDTVLDAGTSQVLTVDDPAGTLSTLTTSPDDGGVYPLTLSLLDKDRTAILDEVTTPLILYPEPPEEPLNLALVVPINDVPARGPEGIFRQDPEGTWPLEDALASDGWLDGLLDSLETELAAGMRVALAPSPRLLEELADMADGYTRGATGQQDTDVPAEAESARAADSALERLRRLDGSDGVQTLLTPYANPDLPSLVDYPELSWLQKQINTAELTVEDILGDRDTGRDWIFSPGSRMDAATLEQLALADAGRFSFFGPTSLEPELDPTALACPEPSPTLACPIRVGLPDAIVDGYASDAPLQARLLELLREPDAETLQRFYAETAMIHTELPGTQRVMQASLPSWQPDPALSAELLGVLRRAPWLTTVTPAEGLQLGLPVVERTVVTSLPSSPSAPDASLYDQIAAANSSVDTFADIQPPESLVERLNRNLLVAQSRSWWTDDELLERGMRYAERTGDIARGELDKVSLRAPGEITLTSEEGEITLSLANEADYPVTVRIVPSSDDVTFDPPFIEDTFEPNGASQFRVDVRSESSGIFPVRVQLRTPDGTDIRTPFSITVRSTTFNDVAVAITLGALAFLILFYALRGVRRRRRSPRPTEATAP